MLNHMYNNNDRRVELQARLQRLLYERPSLVIRKLKVEVAHDHTDVLEELRDVRDQLMRFAQMPLQAVWRRGRELELEIEVFEVLDLEVLHFEVLDLGILDLEVLDLEVLDLEVLALKFSNLNTQITLTPYGTVQV